MARIRQYREEDRKGVLAIWQSVFNDNQPHNEPERSLNAKLAMNDRLLFVAEHADQVIGTVMAGYDGHRGWIYALCVDPDHRREGIGSALMQAAALGLKAQGCVKVNLQIRSGNEAVQKFYQKLGFSAEPRISMGRLL